MSSGTKN